MCGILGVFCRAGLMNRETFQKALDSLSHRGPDAGGVEQLAVNSDWTLWLGHRRLAILDVSPAGAQPMIDDFGPDAQAAIVFNGEVYNHHSLRSNLTDHFSFRSRSDTEVLLKGITQHGAEFLREANGMWALAHWYRGRLILSRDRMGKKPLYYYASPHFIAFASELKALQALGLPLTIDEEALAYFRWLGYIPGESTIYKECRKLPAATWMNIMIQDGRLRYERPVLFWDPLQSYSKQYTRTYDDAIDEFLELLDEATTIRLEADRPIGLFLSGGIDSALVLSALGQLGRKDVDIYTVAMEDPALDESRYAQETAKTLGFDVQLLPLKEADFQRQNTSLCFHYDEPFSDSSQIATMAVAELASQRVKVVLTGDGGDEVFMGYPRHRLPIRIQKFADLMHWFPGALPLLRLSLGSRPGQVVLGLATKALGFPKANLDQKARRLSVALSQSLSIDAIYDILLSVEPRILLHPSDATLLGPLSLMQRARTWYPQYAWEALAERDPIEQMAALDFITYMRDDVLVKVDRGTMAYGLEARSPLLDYRIVEFGRSLPLSFKHREGRLKAILRDALGRRMGGHALSRPKMGFSVPLPKNLPLGSSAASSWNLYVEKQWFEQFKMRAT